VIPQLIFLLIACVYTSILILLIAWYLSTGIVFDPLWLVDAVMDTMPTAKLLFGRNGVILLFIVLFFVTIIVYTGARTLLNQIEDLQDSIKLKGKIALTLLALITASFIPNIDGSVLDLSDDIAHAYTSRKDIEPIVPNNDIYQIDSDESIFILQLESNNAFIQNGDAIVDGKKYSKKIGKTFEAISKDGIYFPYFWSNSMQTNRAHVNILCGIANNIRTAYSLDIDKLNTDCLPKILNEDGYDTLFLGSFYDPNFQNKSTFMSHVGVLDQRHADFMHDSDIKYPWGYDDCTFYNRAFDYIENNYDRNKKKFVYFEVSSHHFPFSNKDEYKDAMSYKDPEDFVEIYSNSLETQDKCLSEFYKRFKEYTDGNTHLFILPDNSWPIGINENTWNIRGVYNDNNLIPFTYIPPANKKSSFFIGKVESEIFAQTDILPTIAELLTNNNFPNSFAFALRPASKNGNEKYERCHVISQPYGGGEIAIVKGDDKYIYKTVDRTLTYFDLSKDMLEKNPVIVEEELPYAKLVDRYFCERFKTD